MYNIYTYIHIYIYMYAKYVNIKICKICIKYVKYYGEIMEFNKKLKEYRLHGTIKDRSKIY